MPWSVVWRSPLDCSKYDALPLAPRFMTEWIPKNIQVSMAHEMRHTHYSRFGSPRQFVSGTREDAEQHTDFLAHHLFFSSPTHQNRFQLIFVALPIFSVLLQ